MNGRGVPDPYPSTAVHAAIDRAIDHERDIVHAELAVLVQRLDDMDKANELLSDTVNRVPTQLTVEIVHLREWVIGQLSRIETELAAASKQAEMTARAQREAATRTEEANSKAIDKAERATYETINNNRDVTAKVTDALAARVDDLKDRVGSLESERRGGNAERVEHRASNAAIYAAIGFAVTVMGAIIIIVDLLINASATGG